MAFTSSPAVLLHSTYRKVLGMENAGGYTEDYIQQAITARTKVLAKERNAQASSLSVAPIIEEDTVITMSDIQQGIGLNKLQIIDIEIEEVQECVAKIAQQAMGDRNELFRLQDLLFDIGVRLQDPTLKKLLIQSDIDRTAVCKELLDCVVQLDVRWARDASQLELYQLQKELASLEQEDEEASRVPVDPMLQLYQKLNDHMEQSAKDMVMPISQPDDLWSPVRSPSRSPVKSPSGQVPISSKQSAELARISNPLMLGYDDSVERIAEATQLELTYIPTSKYIVGLENNPKAPIIAMEGELLAKKYQSQWYYMSQHRRAPSTLSAWNNTFGVLGPGGDDSPIVGFAPPQQVSLKGFFITTQPIRLSDFHRICQVPEYASKLKGLLSDNTLEGYRWNYTPTFVHAEQFGFSSHLKDALEDIDDPYLELPFFKAQQFCEALGGRLPTWQEWEAASRGEDGYLYPWGDALDLNALVFDNPVPWEMKVKAVETSTSFLHSASHQQVNRGNSTRLNKWGVYAYERSAFGLRKLARFGFEWNTANGDLGPNGPTTHLLRTLGDYYTQAIFEGDDSLKCGNHRSFSGPVLPLYAVPNKFTRTAAFRVVFVLPSKTDKEAGYSGPPTAGPTNLCQIEALKRARLEIQDPDIQDMHNHLCIRINGTGGGVMRGSSAQLGFFVGRLANDEDISLPNLILLIGTGVENVLQLLGHPEDQTPHLFDCGTSWSYHSLGIQVTVDTTAKRQVVRELHLFDSTADDLVTTEWNRYRGSLDSDGLTMDGLTVERLETSQRWGKAHSQRSLVYFYLLNYCDVMPSITEEGSRLWHACKQHPKSAISFEFSARPDHSIAKVRIKLCRPLHLD